jgi:galactokinase
VVAEDLGEVSTFSCDSVQRGDLSVAGFRPGAWQSYVFGVMHEVGVWYGSERVPQLPSLRIVIASDVPIGSGLSSSAALEVGVARAMLSPQVLGLDGPMPTDNEVAQLCQRAEHRFAGVPCGIMDQLAASVGTLGVAGVIDCRSLQVRSVPLPDRRLARLLVIDSGIRHRNASGEYAARREACAGAARELGVPALRDADAYMLEHARGELSPELYNCAMHVVSENPRVLMAAEAMRAGDMERLGALMNLSHASLRELLKVSCAEVDAVVDAVQQTTGVYGARMTGAGFGGCVVALVHPDSVSDAQGVASRVIEERTGGLVFSLVL